MSNEGDTLIGAGHFASMEIQTRLDELDSDWSKLQKSSQLKRERLNDAYQVYLVFVIFIRSLN